MMMAQKNEIQVYENAVIVATPLPQLENLCYLLYLPDKDLLQAKVREWIAEFKETNGETE